MPKALVIDDEAALTTVVGRFLERAGFDVDAATSGPEGLRKAVVKQPDVVIVDIMMPDMDGYEVCRRLRRDPRTARATIFVLTARGQLVDRQMALQAGADAHAVKPFTGKELVKDIKRLIAEKPPMGAPMGQQVLVLRLEEGAGATTVATNLALSLAKGRHLTVIIDMVLEGGQVGQRMRLPETSSGLDLWEAGVDADDLAARLMRHDSGLFVLPTSPRSQGLRPDPRMAAQLLVRLQSWYDYLVVDTPRDLGVLTRILLRTSGLVLLLLTPDAEALRSAQTSLAAIRRLDSPSLRIWPVLNMLNSDQRAFQKEVEEMLGLPVAAVLPWSPEECTQAAESGRPVVLSFPESSLAREFDALGQQIVQTVSAP